VSKVGRNDPCICGSGKKLKKCCIDSYEARRREKLNARSKPQTINFDQYQMNSIIDEDYQYLNEVNLIPDLINENKLDEAEEAASNLISKYPESHAGFEMLGLVYKAKGEYKKAVDYLQKALDQILSYDKELGYDKESIDWYRNIIIKLNEKEENKIP
jgi:tetratricopeptide (TPR) repeat protein